MKRILPLVIGAAIAIVAITMLKGRDTAPLPEPAEGEWEPDRQRIDS